MSPKMTLALALFAVSSSAHAKITTYTAQNALVAALESQVVAAELKKEQAGGTETNLRNARITRQPNPSSGLPAWAISLTYTDTSYQDAPARTCKLTVGIYVAAKKTLVNGVSTVTSTELSEPVVVKPANCQFPSQ